MFGTYVRALSPAHRLTRFSVVAKGVNVPNYFMVSNFGGGHQGAHPWYNIHGVGHGAPIGPLGSYSYVDQANYYYGAAPSMVGEASTCFIVMFVDRVNRDWFITHVDANNLPYETLAGLRRWYRRKVNRDLDLFWFTNESDSKYERREVAWLMHDGIGPINLHLLRSRTWYIRGMNGVAWNPYCMISIRRSKNALGLAMTVYLAD